MNETLYVVARDRRQYLDWCRGKGFNPVGRAVTYVNAVSTLHGLSNVRVLCLEGWTDRGDWRQLHEQILYVQRRPGRES